MYIYTSNYCAATVSAVCTLRSSIEASVELQLQKGVVYGELKAPDLPDLEY